MKCNFFAGSLAVRMASCHPAKLAARNKGRIVLVSLVVSFLGAAYQIHVHAQAQCNAAYAWSPATTSTNTSGPASAPVNDTAFNLGHSYSFFAQGKTVYAVRNVADADGPAGTIKWAVGLGSPNTTLVGSPTPAVLSTTGEEVVFVAGEDGNLYKIKVADTTTTFVNLQRPGCTTDGLAGTPAVQLSNLSNSTFAASTGGDDLVFVVTHYIDAGGDCPGGQNRVYALRASNLIVKWVYNQTGSLVLEVGDDAGCVLDYGTNTLFCGFEKSGTTNGLVALNTSATLITGSARWLADTGASVQVRPTLAVTAFGTRLYVATADSFIRAYNSSNGVLLWTGGPASTGFPVAHTPAMFKGNLLVVDSSGTLSAIQDLGTSGTLLWSMSADTTGTVKFSSAPVAVESLGKAYVGRNDGTIQEIDLATVKPGEVVAINPGSADVFDPSLDIEGGASDFNRLVVVADGFAGNPGVVTRLIIPFCAGPTTTALTSSLNPAGAGDSVTLTATVTSPSGTPTGSVTFLEGATILGVQGFATGLGQATLTIVDADSLGVGSFPITANYTPDTTSFTASTATITQTVVMGGVAQTNSNNSFTGNQTISGTLSATSLVGNGSGLSNVTASGLACIGCVGNPQLSINYAGSATQGGPATNALMLGGLFPTAFQPAGSYATTGTNLFSGDQNIAGNLTATGSLTGASGNFTGTLSTAGAVLPPAGTATAAQAFNSNPLDTAASVFNSTGGAAQNHLFRWQAEPVAGSNNTASPSATLNLLFGSNGTPSETGLSINPNGTINFASGQTFPGAGGSGTITGVTAGAGLTGGGSAGNVTLTNAGILSLTAGNGLSSTGGQTPTLSLNTSFTDGRYLLLTGGTLTGSLSAPSFAGNGSALTNLSPANLAAGTAGINITGNAATATVAGTAATATNASNAANAASLGGIPASNYARRDIANSFTGDQSVSGNVSVSGNSGTTGTVTLGSGSTPIKGHLSMDFSPSFAALKPSTCTSLAFTFPGASDGDTIALGVPNVMMTVAGIPNYFAWVSAANTITVRACNLDPNINQKIGASGTIRIDVWKH